MSTLASSIRMPGLGSEPKREITTAILAPSQTHAAPDCRREQQTDAEEVEVDMSAHGDKQAQVPPGASGTGAEESQLVVRGCRAESLQTALTLFAQWLKYMEATAPKVMSCHNKPTLHWAGPRGWALAHDVLTSFAALQESGAEKRDHTYIAAMVYLVERSRFHKHRGREDVPPGTDTDMEVSERVSIRDIIAGTDATVFQFFKAMTKVLELASRQPWLTGLVPEVDAFVHEFKQVEVKFMFVYMLHEKLKKTYREICLEAPDPSGVLRLSDAAYHDNIVKLVWAIYLAVRGEKGLTDLVPGFFLLISSIYLVAASIGPAFSLALVLPDPPPNARDSCAACAQAETSAKLGEGREVLAKLCEAYCVTELDKVVAALLTVHELLDSLAAKGVLKCLEAGIDGRGIARTDDVLHASVAALVDYVRARVLSPETPPTLLLQPQPLLIPNLLRLKSLNAQDRKRGSDFVWSNNCQAIAVTDLSRLALFAYPNPFVASSTSARPRRTRWTAKMWRWKASSSSKRPSSSDPRTASSLRNQQCASPSPRPAHRLVRSASLRPRSACRLHHVEEQEEQRVWCRR
jgi:hypothetical protein